MLSQVVRIVTAGWSVRLQFANSVVFKTRGSRWCNRNCVTSSAYFTGKHNDGKQRAVSEE